MKPVVLIIFLLCCDFVYSQDQTTPPRSLNAVSYEIGGTTGSWININYHRFFPAPDMEGLALAVRVGLAYSRSNTNSTLLRTPIEISLLAGRRPLKFEVGLGYAPIFGNQYYVVFDSWDRYLAIKKNIYVDFYDYFIPRLGIAYIPYRKHYVNFRAAWTPMFVPLHNPPLYANGLAGVNTKKRFFGFGGGFTIGFSF